VPFSGLHWILGEICWGWFEACGGTPGRGLSVAFLLVKVGCFPTREGAKPILESAEHFLAEMGIRVTEELRSQWQINPLSARQWMTQEAL
jgi:hypothetical protein